MRLLVFFFYLGLLPFSRLAAEQWVVPGATNATAFNGLHYATDLKLCNQGSVTASVTLDLITGSGDPPAGAVPQSIAPGQTLVLANVLQSVWGLTERSGALRITADQQLVIAANVYTDTDPAGIYGFELDSFPYERWTTAGATVHSAWISQAADPSAGFTSTIGVVLAAPGSGVDVRVFDAAGNQVGRTQVTGGPAEQRIPVSALAGVDLPAGRVEFAVTSGRALAYALVTDNITGDTLIVSGSPDATQPLDATLTGLVKASSAAPQTERSDVRIFNLSTTQAAAVTVTVLSSSVNSLTAQNKVVTVPAGQIQEIPDILGQLFQAPEGVVGALHFQSPQPAIVLARTATVNTDGSPGTFGAFQSSIATSDFLGAADSATVAGLREDTGDSGTVAAISLLAGADGASANLTLSGPDGSSLASAPLSLGAWQSQETSLADLFSGVSVPDDSRVDVQMTAGELSGFARAADINSGDTWILPVTPGQPYFCPAPAIVSFVASPNALAAAGNTTLYWSAANADTVAISPSVANPPLGGSAAVSVNATTVFTITATGPCGVASQSATVAVGAPAITSISPASGAPGQVLTLKLRNVSNPAAIAQAEIKFSASLTLAAQIQGVTPSGDVTILAPFVSDTTNPAGYLTGAVTIALDLPTGQTAGAPFNILPLTYAGKDATADLQSLTNAAVQFVKAQLNAQQAVPDFAAAIPTLSTTVDQYAAVLNKLASDIAGAGTASLPMIPPSAGASSSVTVTRKQLETFFALYYSMTGASSGGLPPASVGVRPQFSRRDGTPTLCLTNDAAYRTCLSIVGVDPFEPFQGFFLQLIQQSGFGQCTFSGTNATLATVGSYLVRLFQIPEISCYLRPTEIVGFKAQPTPDPIPLGVRNGGTLITATLRPLFNGLTLLTAPFGEALLALNTLPQSCQSQINDAVGQAFETLINGGQEAIQGLINSGALTVSPLMDVPVYKCDVSDLTPLDPSRLARRPDWDNDALYRFGLQGLKNGAAAVHVVPNDRDFMRLTDWSTKTVYRSRYLEDDPNFDEITRVSVNVAGAKRLTVNGSLQGIGPLSPASATSPNQVVVEGADFSVPLITGNYGCPVGASSCNGAAYESHSVTQVNDTTWQIQISSGGYTQGRVSVNFANPPNRNNTQHIVIQTNASGTDCGLYLTASAAGPNGNRIGPAYNILHGDLQAYTIDAPGAVAGGVLLEIDGVTGSSCVANATIQLLDQ